MLSTRDGGYMRKMVIDNQIAVLMKIFDLWEFDKLGNPRRGKFVWTSRLSERRANKLIGKKSTEK